MHIMAFQAFLKGLKNHYPVDSVIVRTTDPSIVTCSAFQYNICSTAKYSLAQLSKGEYGRRNIETVQY